MCSSFPALCSLQSQDCSFESSLPHASPESEQMRSQRHLLG